MEYLTVKEASKILGISERATAKRCLKSKARRSHNRYQITQENIEQWQGEIRRKKEPRKNQNERTSENSTDNLIIEQFTAEEYAILEQRLKQYPVLLKEVELLKESLTDYRNQVTYLQESLSKNQAMLTKSFDTISESLKKVHQQNYIEAKRLGLDTD
jgi:hypothetical protein